MKKDKPKAECMCRIHLELKPEEGPCECKLRDCPCKELRENEES